MKCFIAMVALLLPLSGPCLSGSTPYRHEARVTAPYAEDESERAASKAYALRREDALTRAQTTDDFVAARKALAALMAEPRFEASSPGEQRDVVSAAAWVETRSGNTEEAARFYRRAVQLDPGDPDDWHRLSMAEDILGNYDAALDAIVRIPQDWPHLTDALSAGQVLNLVDHLPQTSEKRLAFMRTLYAANWKREEPSSSGLWLQLALTLIERGEAEEAREVSARIAWPDDIMGMQADRRFDGVVPAEPAYATQSLQALIMRLQTVSHENPRNLYIHNDWLEALLAAGRNEEVVGLADGILSRIAAETPDHTAFHDSDDENFTQELRATALRRLGRLDEAEAALKRASELPEYGEPNEGQKLALGAWYNSRLRPDEAIRTVAQMPPMTERFGLTRRDAVLMQAELLKGNRRQAERHLASVRENVDRAEALATATLLRAGQLDEAARLMVRRLQDPRLRVEALVSMQHTHTPETMPGDVVYRRNRDAMLARDDVRAALERVGRVQSYDIW